jgi:rubredoxin
MLDKPLYGELEKMPPLKCKVCGLYFDKEDDEENWEHIDEFGKCIEC